MISAIILTKNEEKNIEECLKTLGWAEEILVIDDNSEDRTVEIAKKYKARVITHPLNDNFSAQRNFALEKAKGEWVFFIDADERVSPTLRTEILNAIKNNDFNGFIIKREDKIWGQVIKHGENAKVKLIRLGKRDKGKWEKPVHEEWRIKEPIGKLQTPLSHLPHQSIKEFVSEINYYSTLRAKELFAEGRKAQLISILAYPLGKFFKDYLLLFGFLDKMPGFTIALLMSFYSFLVRSKLYLLWKQKNIR